MGHNLDLSCHWYVLSELHLVHLAKLGQHLPEQDSVPDPAVCRLVQQRDPTFWRVAAILHFARLARITTDHVVHIPHVLAEPSRVPFTALVHKRRPGPAVDHVSCDKHPFEAHPFVISQPFQPLPDLAPHGGRLSLENHGKREGPLPAPGQVGPSPERRTQRGTHPLKHKHPLQMHHEYRSRRLDVQPFQPPRAGQGQQIL
mmetsp:Transcript_11165/g.31187  ORF Transcript_11165/g.31187 Transcript_11165/m.31187 type:complete len:201 (+) Transcript_11165:1753-2355(+)